MESRHLLIDLSSVSHDASVESGNHLVLGVLARMEGDSVRLTFPGVDRAIWGLIPRRRLELVEHGDPPHIRFVPFCAVGGYAVSMAAASRAGIHTGTEGDRKCVKI
jgi:hypothetical protein